MSVPSQDLALVVVYRDGENFKTEHVYRLQNDANVSIDEAQRLFDTLDLDEVLAEQWGLPNPAPYSFPEEIDEDSNDYDGCYVELGQLELAGNRRDCEETVSLQSVLTHIQQGGDPAFLQRRRDASQEREFAHAAPFEQIMMLLTRHGGSLSTEQLATITSATLRLQLLHRREDVLILDFPTLPAPQDAPRALLDEAGTWTPQDVRVVLGAELGMKSCNTIALHARSREISPVELFKPEKRTGGAPVVTRQKISKQQRRQHR